MVVVLHTHGGDELMWDVFGEQVDWQFQVKLANYVPGPLNPRSYYYEPGIFPCGCSEEDTDGLDCGHGHINYPPAEPKEQVTELDLAW